MRRTAAVLLPIGLVLLVRCGSAGPGDTQCSLTGVGHECTQDSDCCTGYCLLYEDAAYCQAKPAVEQACVTDQNFCTQNRNCCSGLCDNNLCFGNGNQCLELGSACTDSNSCCTGYCLNDNGFGGCAFPPVGDGGLGCALGGQACGQASDCCFGLCLPQGVCATPTGGGDGGTNCGQSGAYCRYGSDCCSNQCQKLTSTSQCR